MAAEHFADQAARLAGCAGALLGWRPDEFWAATPVELGTVLRALASGGSDEDAQAIDAVLIDRLKEMFPDG